MSFLRTAVLSFSALSLWIAPLAMAQPAQVAAPAPAAAPAPGSYTDLLKPPLGGLRDTLMGLRLDKWKGGSVRAEAEHDVSSIMDNLNNKVPDLLRDADAAPTRIGAALPLVRDFAAVYDVSLRLLDAARIAAPADQAAKMQDALNSLAAANRGLYDRLEQGAAAQQTHIGDLETKIKAQQETVAHLTQVSATTPAPVCPAPAKKPAVKKKPAAKPATTTQQGSGSGASTGSAQPQKPQN